MAEPEGANTPDQPQASRVDATLPFEVRRPGQSDSERLHALAGRFGIIYRLSTRIVMSHMGYEQGGSGIYEPDEHPEQERAAQEATLASLLQEVEDLQARGTVEATGGSQVGQKIPLEDGPISAGEVQGKSPSTSHSQDEVKPDPVKVAPLKAEPPKPLRRCRVCGDLQPDRACSTCAARGGGGGPGMASDPGWYR